jgi:hypothetical protein
MFSESEFSEEREDFDHNRYDKNELDNATFFRRFAPGWERPTPEQQREWFHGKGIFPDVEKVSYDGTINNDCAHMVLTEIVGHELRYRQAKSETGPQSGLSAMEIADRTFMNPFQVRSICRQLCTGGHWRMVLEEYPANSTRFRIYPNISQEKFHRLCVQTGYLPENPGSLGTS